MMLNLALGRLRRYRLRFKGWRGPCKTSGAGLRTAGAPGIGLEPHFGPRFYTILIDS